MKLSNQHLGLALADAAVANPTDRQHEIMRLADYLLTHPTSSVYYERALLELGIPPDSVPSELWGDNLPEMDTAVAALKAAIDALAVQWSGGQLHRTVVVRNLAWQATQLARRLEHDMGESAKRVIAKNGGKTAGLLSAFVTPATRVELDAMTARQ